jgi:hypothetical protein
MLGPEGARVSPTRACTKRACARQAVCDSGSEQYFQPYVLPRGGDHFAANVTRHRRSTGKGNIIVGFALGEEFPEYENVLLMCATKTKTGADTDRFFDALKRASSRFARADHARVATKSCADLRKSLRNRTVRVPRRKIFFMTLRRRRAPLASLRRARMRKNSVITSYPRAQIHVRGNSLGRNPHCTCRHGCSPRHCLRCVNALRAQRVRERFETVSTYRRIDVHICARREKIIAPRGVIAPPLAASRT